MVAFPAMAATVALLCAGVVGWDAVKRPRPERLIWTGAFLVFAVAAAAEVVASIFGWSPHLARLYYLAGAVLVVGILALGELYLLFPGRMPAVVPGAALLVMTAAATTVWSAPVDAARMPAEGWRAIERGPLLVALAATINAGGTLVLVAGALYSAWKLRHAAGSRRRVMGCMLIAAGTIAVAFGGTLTRFGRPELLYLAMASGIAIIFAGVLLTRQQVGSLGASGQASPAAIGVEAAARRPRLVPLPSRPRFEQTETTSTGEGVRFVAEHILVGDAGEVADACRRWSATPIAADELTRQQALQVWTLRVSLPEAARSRLDALPLAAQAQIAELYDQIWSSSPRHDRRA